LTTRERRTLYAGFGGYAVDAFDFVSIRHRQAVAERRTRLDRLTRARYDAFRRR
jgi:hypothetical protein